VGAGSVGIESAIHLKREGKKVTVVEMAPDMSHLSVSAGGAAAMELTRLIQELEIPVHLNCKLEEITDAGILCRNTQTNERVEFAADTVLLALGMSANQETADSLRRSAPETEVFVVGDASEVGTIATAVMSAFRAAAYI
jgi:NADPH-dependent 2,4-dienoyl-CoA reductase/sulfur reductase-like enzyme